MSAGPDENMEACLDNSAISITHCAVVRIDELHDMLSYHGLVFLFWLLLSAMHSNCTLV